MQELTRRSALAGMAAILGSAPLVATGGNARAVSRKAGAIPYGAATQIEPFRADSEYRAALKKYCDMVVPMNALKWATLRHTKGRFDFNAADELVDFALENGKTLHGHTLLWYDFNPKWVEQISTRRMAERALADHIEQVVDRYRGKIPTWDVVNEVIAHDPRENGVWRESLWLEHLGSEHVDLAFKFAARTDPKAKLIINDYDLANWGPRFDLRRQAIIDLVRHLQDRNIPIHGVGMQAHLYAEREIDHLGVAKFMRDLEALGVKIWISELDVIDWRMIADPRRRDLGTASVVEEFLSAIFEGGRPQAVTTWGISDRYSWISDVFPRKDGNSNRPLPLDRQYARKPMMDVIEKYRLIDQ